MAGKDDRAHLGAVLIADETSGEQVWELARKLYSAYCAWEIATNNMAHPRWFALRDDIQEKFLSLAEVLLLQQRSEDDPYLARERGRA